MQGARNLDLALIAAKEGLVYDSDAPGHLVVRAPSAVSIRFTVKGLEAHAGVAPERGLSAIKIASEAIAAMRLGRIDRRDHREPRRDRGWSRGQYDSGGSGGARRSAFAQCGQVARPDRSHDRMLQGRGRARECDVLDGKRIAASFEHSVHRAYDGMDIPDDAPLVKKVIEAARRIGRVLEPARDGRRLRRQHPESTRNRRGECRHRDARDSHDARMARRQGHGGGGRIDARSTASPRGSLPRRIAKSNSSRIVLRYASVVVIRSRHRDIILLALHEGVSGRL